MKAKSVNIDGLKVNYREAGQGNKRILLLNGFAMGSWEFEAVMDELAADYHVIAMDMPGMGGSEGHSIPFEKPRELAKLIGGFAE